MSQQVTRPSISVFGSKPKDAIMVPPLPIGVRNNCQRGEWAIGDEFYGNKAAITILKFSKFFGNLGMTKNTLWGQIWFVVESGNLPHDVVMVTYLKTRSLDDFNRMVTEVQARGIEPGEGIFIPEFIKQSGTKNGNPTNYYSLKWSWIERTDWTIVEKAAAVLADPLNQSLMVDLDGTREMVCIDNLPPHEIACLLASSDRITSSRSPAALPEHNDAF